VTETFKHVTVLKLSSSDLNSNDPVYNIRESNYNNMHYYKFTKS